MNQLKTQHQRFLIYMVGGVGVSIVAIVLLSNALGSVLASRITKPVQVYFRSDSAELVNDGKIVYEHPDFGPRPATISEGHAVLQDMPYGATKVRVNRIENSRFVTRNEKEKKASPWDYEVQDFTVSIPMVSIVLRAPELPGSHELLKFIRANGHDVATIADGPAATIPDTFVLRTYNETGAEIDVLLFNCRHLGALPEGVVAIEDTVDHVTLSEPTGETAYPKWIPLERLKDIPITEREPNARSARRSDKRLFEQVYRPTGYFVAVVRYRDPRNNLLRQELLGVYNILQSSSPRLEIQGIVGKPGAKYHGALTP